MTDPLLRPLRINALELLRQPGAERAIDVAIPATALDVVHDRLAADRDTPVEVAVRLIALTDGVEVAGTVAVVATGECRRCLADVSGRVVVAVDELYQTEVTDPDAFPIEHGQLDLTPMVREAMLLELDDEVQCRPDCRGLCPVCGADRNVESCECDSAPRDDRWAALDELRLDD